MRGCSNCSKYKTFKCPQGSLCYFIKTKPYWESAGYKNKEKELAKNEK